MIRLLLSQALYDRFNLGSIRRKSGLNFEGQFIFRSINEVFS